MYPYRYILDLETKFLVNISISDIVSYYWTSLKIIRTLKKYIYNLISVFICSILYLSENNFFVYFYLFHSMMTNLYPQLTWTCLL